MILRCAPRGAVAQDQAVAQGRSEKAMLDRGLWIICGVVQQNVSNATGVAEGPARLERARSRRSWLRSRYSPGPLMWLPVLIALS
jgi:hypothetical protein